MHDTAWQSTCSEKEDLDVVHGGDNFQDSLEMRKQWQKTGQLCLSSSGRSHTTCLSQVKKWLLLLHAPEDKISSCLVPALMLRE